MSVLSQPYAVPSRVLGVYRYLLQARGQNESLDVLCRLLRTEPLIGRSDRASDANDEGGGREMVRKTIQECGSMRLLMIEPDDTVRIHPDLSKQARDPALAEGLIRLTISGLFFQRDNPTNHDFGYILAWYLAQDVYNPPGHWNTVDKALRTQVGGDRFGVTNNVPYAMLEDWATFLGFVWMHSLKGKSVMTPDPTAHLKVLLPEVFLGRKRIRQAMPEVMHRLSADMPRIRRWVPTQRG